MVLSIEDSAYTLLQITDRNISDNDLVASFYKFYTNPPKELPRHYFSTYIGALKIIATVRQSRLLLFILTIIPNLNEHNTGLRGPGMKAQVRENIVDLTEPDSTHPGTIDDSSGSGGEHPSEEEPTLTPDTSGFELTDSLYSESPTPRGDSQSFADVASISDDSMETSSESSRECGQYHDGQTWRCEACAETPADCGCPNGQPARRCAICGHDVDLEYCTGYCSKCHDVIGEPCTGCLVVDEYTTSADEPEDSDALFWDPANEIWRCSDHFWEVEANHAQEGYCHCKVDDKRITSYPYRDVVRRIELLEYPEFDPADSDSSVADSTDSEPDSEDIDRLRCERNLSPSLVSGLFVLL
ncbi:MAG: hypothetical protein Q9188_006181 [Gyalolechia gomerana]